MKKFNSVNKQAGFFDFGVTLLLVAIFSGTAAIMAPDTTNRAFAENEVEIDFIKGSDYVTSDLQVVSNEEEVEIDFIRGSDYVSNDEQLAENDDEVEIDFISGSEYVDNEVELQTAFLNK